MKNLQEFLMSAAEIKLNSIIHNKNRSAKGIILTIIIVGKALLA